MNKVVNNTSFENTRVLNHVVVRVTILCLAWYAEFLLEIDLNIIIRKTAERLNFKIALISLHIDTDVSYPMA